MKVWHLLLTSGTIASVFASIPVSASTIVDFGLNDNQLSLPYTEDGITFASLDIVEGVIQNGRLLVGPTPNDPVRIRASSNQLFDLISMEFTYLFQSLRIESSRGGVMTLFSNNPNYFGIVEFTQTAGFSGISHFDLVHDLRENRAAMRVDNINLVFVPEPAGILLAAACFIALVPLCLGARILPYSSSRVAPTLHHSKRQSPPA